MPSQVFSIFADQAVKTALVEVRLNKLLGLCLTILRFFTTQAISQTTKNEDLSQLKPIAHINSECGITNRI